MPELPEVQTIVSNLNSFIVGQTVVSVNVLDTRIICADSVEFEAFLTGNTINTISRIGKLIIWDCSKGWMTTHLRMTGKFRIIKDESSDLGKHDHLVIRTKSHTLSYHDVRKFGGFRWFTSRQALDTYIKGYGIDALDPTLKPQKMLSLYSTSQRVLKTCLLDQSKISGIGNIYADEICFAAGIDPRRKASTLTLNESEVLYNAMRSILLHAVEQGGSSISDYQDLYEKKGDYAQYHAVYGRAGLACLACSRPLSKCIIQGRTTVFCSFDQS